MNGWKLVPVEMTHAQADAVFNAGLGIFGDYAAALAAAPDPDWEAMAGVACNAFVHATSEWGGRVYSLEDKMIAALKAALGGDK